MNATTVYDVAKSLPIAEQKVLFEMLRKEFGISTKSLKKQKQPILMKEMAFQYLLNNVFNKKP
jgi:hypothetical protein